MGDVQKCPVHGIPDCSPLLNGCSRLTSSPPVTWTFTEPEPTDVVVPLAEGTEIVWTDADGNVVRRGVLGPVIAADDYYSIERRIRFEAETPAGGRAPVDGVAPDGSEPTSPPAGRPTALTVPPDLFDVIRDYLLDETDVTSPSHHAKEIADRLRSCVEQRDRYRLAWLSARIGRAAGMSVDGRRADRLLRDLPPRVRRLTFRRWRRA